MMQWANKATNHLVDDGGVDSTVLSTGEKRGCVEQANAIDRRHFPWQVRCPRQKEVNDAPRDNVGRHFDWHEQTLEVTFYIM